MRKISFVIFLLLFSIHLGFAGDFLVVGQVFDALTKQAISNVSVYNKANLQGTETDAEGFYYIKCNADVQTIVFSHLGYKTKEIKLKERGNQALRIYLQEEEQLLKDLFVLPGVDPALPIIQELIKRRKENDIYYQKELNLKGKSEQLFLLQNRISRNVSGIQKAFLENGFKTIDSLISTPLLKKSESFRIITKNEKEILETEVKASPENLHQLFEKFAGIFPLNLNFYESSVTILGKSFISPLSSSGSVFYKYFLIDSSYLEGRKYYSIGFRSQNPRNLAFNGSCMVDAESYALKKMLLKLPPLANLNFVQEIGYDINYNLSSGRWIPSQEKWNFLLVNNFFGEQNAQFSSVRILKNNVYEISADSIVSNSAAKEGYAGSGYKSEDLNEKLESLNKTKILKAAAWIADAYLTGNMKFGKVDLGKIYQLARVSDIEGLRLNLPLMTNEKFSKNFSVGGYLGYATRNDQWKYRGELNYKLPLEKRMILGLKYTDDYRKVNFSHNNYFLRENPHYSGDANMFNTIFGLFSENKMYEFKSFEASVFKDWNEDVESKLFFRNEKFLNNPILNMHKASVSFPELNVQSFSLVTRFSFKEKSYDDHMQRIYIRNWSPVFYLTMEAGRFDFTSYNSKYARITASAAHKFLFDLGQWNYYVEGSYTLGDIPWPMMYIPADRSHEIFGQNRFMQMKTMEFVADKYISIYNEWVFNGLIFNYIPVLNNWKLREILGLKLFYGSFNKNLLMDMPEVVNLKNEPYLELNGGFTNLFKILSIQGIWRLTGETLPGFRSDQLSISLRFNF